MTQLVLIAFSLAAASAELTVDELLAPAVDLVESEDNVGDDSARRIIGPPSTISVNHWRRGHIHSQNSHRCPPYEPNGGDYCSSSDAHLECYYEETCCPDNKRCTARKIARCNPLLGPSPSQSWSVSDYGRAYYKHGGKCYLGHASRRRTSDDELRRVMPEMDVQTASDGIQQDDDSLSRRMIGPPSTWPVDRWGPNPRNCPWDTPEHGAWGSDNDRGLSCRYERVCCPDHKRCVAHKQAVCEMMLPSGCTWRVSYYGTRTWEHGVCRCVHSSDTGDVPSNYPSNNQPLYG